jgi:hypothetical protein
MSVSDQIFLRCGLSPHQAAVTIAASLGLTVAERNGKRIVSGPGPGSTGRAGGSVCSNYLGNEPGVPSIVDHYDVLWNIHAPDDTVHAEALRLFALVTQRLPWPALLMHDLSWVVAVWSPKRGAYDLPHHVSPDSEAQPTWLPAIPARR